MLLGGLWHGAALNFVFWGAWHGLLLLLARHTRKHDAEASAATILRRRFLCFHLIVFSWLLFRIGHWALLVDYLKGLFSLGGSSVLHPVFYMVLAAAFVSHWVPQEWQARYIGRFARLPAAIQAAAYAVLILVFSGFSLGAPAFIYFQF